MTEEKWPRLNAWFNEMKVRPSYKKMNAPGVLKLQQLVNLVAKFKLPI